MNPMAISRRPRVVIVGAGFGGLFAAKALNRVEADVTLVDRRNYHLFQPLLYQVAAAALAPSDIAWPIRSILSRQRNTSVRMDDVIDIDADRRRVMLSGGSIEFDYLVVATGATHSYFGHEDWAAAAPGLKSLDDATLIRRRVLTAFEQAEMERDKTALDRLLRFVIVGGGPTGVELAGSIAELARHTLAADFRRIDPRSAKVMLVEAGSRLLPSFHESLSHYAHRSLERLNVEVRLGSAVTDCSAAGVVLGGETIPAATVIWAAGVAATPVGRWLDAKMDRSGKVIVESDLSVPGHPDIFVIGDAALVLNERGDAVPGIAPAAKQQGRYVGRVIGARIRKVPLPGDFRYRDAGGLATIGRKSAVIEFHRIRLKGWLAWWIWGIAHIYFLVGVPSPLLVSIRWLWEYITYGRGARLIIRAKDAD
jgi:NADH dehydrogenase